MARSIPRDLPIVGVLYPLRGDGELGPPSAVPLGRAALALADRAVVVIGDRVEGGVMTGFCATGGRWEAVEAPLTAAYDRYPSQSRAKAYAELVRGLGAVPLGNPPALNALCRDKLASQRALEAAGVAMPELVDTPEGFAEALERWPEGGFLKPRHGSFGRGVRHVRADDELPARAEGAVPGELDDMVLQRAVAPPDGWAGVSIRQLVQRTGLQDWAVPVAAVRRHRTEPVVNVAREAEVVPGDDALSVETRQQMAEVARSVAQAIAMSPHAVELGLDFALAADGTPWLIEVNARPRGHLHVLARHWPDRFGAANATAVERPLRWMTRR